MFSRVIPSLDIIKNFKQPLTEGEKALITYLNENLQIDKNFDESLGLDNYNGWLIFVQPFLNGCRPDIIVFHPRVGVQIFEVKDWNLDNYTFIKNDRGQSEFVVTDRTGSYPIKTPIQQVVYYKEKLTGQLIPQIGEQIDSDFKKYGLIKTAIYFHNSTTRLAQNLFKTQIKDYTKFPVFGNDKLLGNNLKQVVPDSYLEQSFYWKMEWNKDILFWLNPPFHSLEQTVVLTLNKYQKLFSEPLSGHHRVRGVAGSGKTQVLAYRAGKLASQGYRVLILTFNITLWHFVRDMIQRSPFEFEWKQFTFNHFHGFCKDILNEYGEKWPSEYEDDEEVFRSIVPNMVLDLIKGKNYEKYDAILIDEGQDYYIEWYQMLSQFLTNRDEVVVVCDKKQNIYGRDMEWLDKRRRGVEKFGEWTELKTIVRMPEKIASITKKFSEIFKLNQEVKVDNIERPDLFKQFEEHFLWWNILPFEWLQKIEEAFNMIRSYVGSSHISDTVVLLPDRIFGLQCVSYFKDKMNIEVNHIFETDNDIRSRKHKKSFWMGDSRLKISTIHSFKGWEVLNVILFIPEEFYGSQELYNRVIYTALTRTRQNLIVINAHEYYKEFGERISKDVN